MVYLYCVTGVNAGEAEAPDGAPIDLGVIRHGDVYAVVSRVSRDEFGEEAIVKNLADIKWLESSVVLHERVVEMVMENGPVVPFKFATIFETEDRVRAMLEDRAEEYGKLLGWLCGKQEWGVKAYCNTAGTRRALREATPEIKCIDEEIKSSNAGKAYLLGKKGETAVDGAFRKCTDSIIKDCKSRLGAHCADIKLNTVLPSRATGRDEEMLLNAACLVDTAGLDGFKDAAAGLSAEYGMLAVKFICNGPWPPYNFCG